MKYVRLLLKVIALILLVLIRTEEIDVSHWYAHSKFRGAYDYYIATLASIAIFLLLLDFIQYFVVGFYRRRHNVPKTDNFIVGIGHIYSIILVLGLAVGLLSLFRLEVKEVLTSMSIVFAGLALLTKDYIANMVNGMIVTFSGQVSIGDSVSIGEHRGKVIEITLQNIHILTDDDDVIYIPNSLLLTSEIINYTKREIKRTSIDFEIDLKYLNTVEELEKIMYETLRPFHDQLKEGSYYLRTTEVKKDSVSMKVQYVLTEPDKELDRTIRRIVVRKIVALISSREKFVDQIPDLPEDAG